nr:hypothetical protein [uncultured bacterium]
MIRDITSTFEAKDTNVVSVLCIHNPQNVLFNDHCTVRTE